MLVTQNPNNMNWKIGQKIVCVRDCLARCFQQEILPKKGEIYTIREITHYTMVCFRLVEIVNPVLSYEQGVGEATFDAKHFRPIVDIGDDVEEYIKTKVEQEELQPA